MSFRFSPIQKIIRNYNEQIKKALLAKHNVKDIEDLPEPRKSQLKMIEKTIEYLSKKEYVRGEYTDATDLAQQEKGKMSEEGRGRVLTGALLYVRNEIRKEYSTGVTAYVPYLNNPNNSKLYSEIETCIGVSPTNPLDSAVEKAAIGEFCHSVLSKSLIKDKSSTKDITQKLTELDKKLDENRLKCILVREEEKFRNKQEEIMSSFIRDTQPSIIKFKKEIFLHPSSTLGPKISPQQKCKQRIQPVESERSINEFTQKDIGLMESFNTNTAPQIKNFNKSSLKPVLPEEMNRYKESLKLAIPEEMNSKINPRSVTSDEFEKAIRILNEKTGMHWQRMVRNDREVIATQTELDVSPALIKNKVTTQFKEMLSFYGTKQSSLTGDVLRKGVDTNQFIKKMHACGFNIEPTFITLKDKVKTVECAVHISNPLEIISLANKYDQLKSKQVKPIQKPEEPVEQNHSPSIGLLRV